MPRVAVATKAKKPVSVALSDPAVMAERFKDYPAIEVLSRRFNNPNDPGSLPILLKDEDANACVNTDHQNVLKPGSTKCLKCGKPARKWYVRWFNLASEGRNAQMRAKGYVPVEMTELPDVDDIADLYRSDKDRFVRRGDHGKEILGKMPLELFTYVKTKQRQAWSQSAISKTKTRQALAESAGAELGDEAGQSIHDGMIQIESLTQTKTTLGDEAGVDSD